VSRKDLVRRTAQGDRSRARCVTAALQEEPIAVETVGTKEGSRALQIMRERKDYDVYGEMLCNP